MNTDDKQLILLVDDVPQNIQVLYQILSGKDCSFAIATNGEDAFKAIERKKPDLILLDIMLPDIDGFAICERLKKDDNTKNIPVIFLTAKVEMEDKIRAFDLGAVDYITKPFEELEVIARIETHLEIQNSKKLIEEYNKKLEDSYKQLEESRNMYVEQEKKAHVLGLAIKANEDIKVPLDKLSEKVNSLINDINEDELSEKVVKYVDKIKISVDKMFNILEKYKSNINISFDDYADKVKMVVFKDSLGNIEK